LQSTNFPTCFSVLNTYRWHFCFSYSTSYKVHRNLSDRTENLHKYQHSPIRPNCF